MAILSVKYLLSTFLIVAVILLVALVVTSGGSAGGTLQSGRCVVAHTDSVFLSCTFGSDTATIRDGRVLVVVKPTSLLVDGLAVADIDKDVAQVQVQIKRGVATFVADGKPVQSALR